ncbi:MAG: macro domain-containing protein [Deltaproteobacteria bacterium]|nr:macro domain-containing protein [Deltaproteobacteria bacterium]MCW5806856.1 macro domain-containing protein [Deltaproteobacteria bacterium]
MIELTRGDILRARTDAIVNTVNCVGYMGRGIAAQFKRAYPDNFRVYEAACKRGEVHPGQMLVFELAGAEQPRWIINFPTKRHWRASSRVDDIEAGLAALIGEVRRRDIRSIAVPALGCGLGGLDWAQVKPLIEDAFGAVPDVRVALYEPAGAPASDAMARSAKSPPMTAGRAALVGLVRRYMSGLMDPFVSLLEIHKLMYFAQEAGEPLKLRYVKAVYGPYAENLRHVLAAVEGHLLSGYADGGDAPDKQLQLVAGAAEAADAFLAAHPETRERFERVSALVEGFETPFGTELLATVHWLLTHDGVPDARLVDAVYAWNDRKKQFSPRQIELARDVLRDKGWTSPASV